MAQKEKYLVVMYLPWKGKRYNNGDFIWLTPEEAARVPGHRIEKVQSIADRIDSDFDVDAGSAGNDAKDAIEYIEQASDEELNGFLTEDEERVTVLRAWDARFGTSLQEERT